MKKVILLLAICSLSVGVFAEDHVMAAARTQNRNQDSVPAFLSLSLSEAQEYAVQQNRSLKNASMAVQEAYAQR